MPGLLQHLVDQELPIDGLGHGAADRGVGGRPGLGVQSQVADAGPDEFLQLLPKARIRLDTRRLAGGKLRHLHVSRFIPCQLLGRVGQ